MSKPSKASTLSLDKFPPRLRVGQAASYLNCSEYLVLLLIRTGKLAALDTRSPRAKQSYYLVKREDVAEFERRNTVI